MVAALTVTILAASSRAEDRVLKAGKPEQVGMSGPPPGNREPDPDGRNQERARDRRLGPRGAARRHRLAWRLGDADPGCRQRQGRAGDGVHSRLDLQADYRPHADAPGGAGPGFAQRPRAEVPARVQGTRKGKGAGAGLADAYLGFARHAAGECQAPRSERAAGRVRQGRHDHAAALRAAHLVQLLQHGHPPGSGRSWHGSRKCRWPSSSSENCSSP